MKLNYEVEWELGDEIIDNIVEEVENMRKQYPEDDLDDCILGIIEDNLCDMNYDECDLFNLDVYIDRVAEEIKKRCFDRKQKSTALPATPAEELHSGYIQRMDGFGRIFIPKDLRCLLNLKDDDTFEIFFDTDHNIVLKKYHG